MSFRILPLDPTPFLPLFSLDEAELARQHAQRVIATHKPGFPCRVSLADADPGEELLLVNFEHQPAPTPFRASHAIYVRRDVEAANPGLNEIPAFLQFRTLSLRAFSDDGMLLAAEVVAGGDLDKTIPRLLLTPKAAYLHVHSAAMGCYLARAEQA